MDAVMADRKVTANKQRKEYSNSTNIKESEKDTLIPKPLTEGPVDTRVGMKYNKSFIDSNGIDYSSEDRSNGLDKQINKDIWTQVYDELCPTDSVALYGTKLPELKLSQRYSNNKYNPIGITPEGYIVVYASTPERLDAAKQIADAYNVDITDVIPTAKVISDSDKNRKFKRIVKVKSDFTEMYKSKSVDEGLGVALATTGKAAWAAIKFCGAHLPEIATALEALGVSLSTISEIVDKFKKVNTSPADDKSTVKEFLPVTGMEIGKTIGQALSSVVSEEKSEDEVEDKSKDLKENYSTKKALRDLNNLTE